MDIYVSYTNISYADVYAHLDVSCFTHSGLVDSISVGRWLDERNYEVAGDLTTGVSLAASKGRQMRDSHVRLIF